eukprot:5854282-Amphidinium_carterae.1
MRRCSPCANRLHVSLTAVFSECWLIHLTACSLLSPYNGYKTESCHTVKAVDLSALRCSCFIGLSACHRWTLSGCRALCPHWLRSTCVLPVVVLSSVRPEKLRLSIREVEDGIGLPEWRV